MYKKLFFQTVRLYYKEGEINDGFPFFKIYLMHVGAFTMQLICLRYTVCAFIFNFPFYKLKATKLDGYLAIIIAAVLGYLLFLKDKKYLEIYKRYENDAFYSSWQSKVIIIVYFIFSILSPFIFAVIYNWIQYGKVVA